MRRWSQLIIFYILVFMVSLAGTMLGLRFFNKPAAAPAKKPQGGHLGNTEPWLHQQLNLTEQQRAALHSRQEAFQEQELRLERQMAEAQDVLGNLVRVEQKLTPAMLEQLDKINDAHRELQRITLVHLFDTHAELDETRRSRLLELVGEALEDPLKDMDTQPPISGTHGP